MRDTKNPTADILPGLSPPQVLEKREKDFLDDLFSIVGGKPEGNSAAEQRVVERFKELCRRGTKNLPSLKGLDFWLS